MAVPNTGLRKALILFSLLVLLPACGESRQSQLRIASDATFAPFHLLDDSGNPTGFDIELARAVAEQAGLASDVLVLPYDELFSGLTGGSHDVIAATTGITPERERIYLFTDAYFETCQAAVVRVGPAEPASLADLQGARIGAAGSGTARQAMLSIASAEHLRLEEGRGVQSLATGTIDAWIVDEFDAVAAARASAGRLRVLPQPVALERYGFVIAPGREELKSRLDRSLAQLEKSGRVAELRRRFGVERDGDWPVSW